jgi:hypothetical protein
MDKIAIELAIGRILALGSRGPQDGDMEMYEKCRKIIMTIPETPGTDGGGTAENQ